MPDLCLAGMQCADLWHLPLGRVEGRQATVLAPWEESCDSVRSRFRQAGLAGQFVSLWLCAWVCLLRWLIDFEALAEPGILGRILNWALSKDNSECSAFAAALNSFHPGHLELEWYVWETQQSRAALDVNVRAFSAPSKLCVVGRATSSENGDIAGDYFLCPETHKAWPAFRKKNSTMAIRREQTRWVIDRDGLRDSLICTAFASATPGFQHAGDGGSQKWHVYDSRSGSHLLDPNLQVLTDALEGDKSDSEPASKKRRECVPASHAQFGA